MCSETGYADRVDQRDVTWPARVGAHPVEVRVHWRKSGAERHVVSHRRAAGRRRQGAADVGQVRNYFRSAWRATQARRQRSKLHVQRRKRRRKSVDDDTPLRTLYAWIILISLQFLRTLFVQSWICLLTLTVHSQYTTIHPAPCGSVKTSVLATFC